MQPTIPVEHQSYSQRKEEKKKKKRILPTIDMGTNLDNLVVIFDDP